MRTGFPAPRKGRGELRDQPPPARSRCTAPEGPGYQGWQGEPLGCGRVVAGRAATYPFAHRTRRQLRCQQAP
ncbi:hypothetical protein GCM10010359_05010 [Streptomyces morookaense]|nr:hypothetical protein GCM10010359_05010 [Streptomyces morookaense]